MYSHITHTHIEQLKHIVGNNYVLVTDDAKKQYGKDETENLFFSPEVIVKPITPEEIASILKWANKEKIPITPRGGGTGLSGGALPLHGGVLLSMERFDKIIHIDEKNLQVTTETGVITEVLMNAVKEKKMFYPPDPASKGSCFIGGNIAENSGGPKAVKYGVVKDYVLNLEVVLPTGDIIWTGANTLKNSTGYHLTQLMVGSEGTLGIVTKAVLRLIPLPAHDLLTLIPYRSLEKACETVSAIFKAGFTPSACEIMHIDALKIVSKQLENKTIPLPDHIEAHLLIEVDGNHLDILYKEIESIVEIAQSFDSEDALFADTAAQKEELWKMRRRTAEILRTNGYTIEEDTVVPRYELPSLVRKVKELALKYDFKAVAYGHAGDGNLHVRIKKEGMPHTYENNTIKTIMRELFTYIHSLGGTISAEHGIGLIQKDYMNIMFNPTSIQIMQSIKDLFDPLHILNPGKILPFQEKK